MPPKIRAEVLSKALTAQLEGIEPLLSQKPVKSSPVTQLVNYVNGIAKTPVSNSQPAGSAPSPLQTLQSAVSALRAITNQASTPGVVKEWKAVEKAMLNSGIHLENRLSKSLMDTPRPPLDNSRALSNTSSPHLGTPKLLAGNRTISGQQNQGIFLAQGSQSAATPGNTSKTESNWSTTMSSDLKGLLLTTQVIVQQLISQLPEGSTAKNPQDQAFLRLLGMVLPQTTGSVKEASQTNIRQQLVQLQSMVASAIAHIQQKQLVSLSKNHRC